MNGGTEPWKVTQAEFRGYMKANVESIHKKLDAVDKKNETQDTNISKNTNNISNIKGQATMLGLIAGTVVTFVAWLISKIGGR